MRVKPEPANYDFTATRDMKSVHDSDDATMEVQKDLEGASVVKVEHEHAIDGRESVVRDGIRPVEDECHDARSPESLEDRTHKALEAVYKRAAIYSTLLTVCVTIIGDFPPQY